MIYECEGCAHGEHDTNCQYAKRPRHWHNTDGRLVTDDLGHNVTLWLIELGYDAWLGIDRIGRGIPPVLLKFANSPVPIPQLKTP
ncbi:hypothetical protein LCGC14_2079880 [marine sediment metagenome]|uniref:Uncharacterized protein n=1 Tax=marine sediment metagenome TaxID=412755 RepID=A0A0F9HCV9_9ZZZZ